MDDTCVPELKDEVRSGVCVEVDEGEECPTDVDGLADDVGEVKEVYPDEERVEEKPSSTGRDA